ncbi:hypothetical protein QUB13_26520 [Microcoleus sp. B4-D4]
MKRGFEIIGDCTDLPITHNTANTVSAWDNITGDRLPQQNSL